MTLGQKNRRHRMLIDVMKTACVFRLLDAVENRWPCNEFAYHVCEFPRSASGPPGSYWPEALESHFKKHPADNIYGAHARRMRANHFRRIWRRLGYKNTRRLYEAAIAELKKEGRVVAVQRVSKKWEYVAGFFRLRTPVVAYSDYAMHLIMDEVGPHVGRASLPDYTRINGEWAVWLSKNKLSLLDAMVLPE